VRPVRRASVDGGTAPRRGGSRRGQKRSEALAASLRRTTRAGVAFVFAVAIVAGAAYAYREFAASGYFALRNVELSGDLRAPRRELISSLYANTSGGLWQADLDALREKLRTHPWVRDAEVVRVLPDTLRVKISEREPYTLARLERGTLVWVDRDGVILDEQGSFKGAADIDKGLPLISGLNEKGAQAREANRQMLLVYERLIDELRNGEPPLLDRIEEAHFGEVEGVQLQLAGKGVRVIARPEDFHGQVKAALAVIEAVAQRDLATLELFRVTDAEQLFGGRAISYINTKSPTHVIIGLAR
jgi:cell division protein FtsQ